MEELAGPLNEVIEDFRAKWREFKEAEPLWNLIQGFVAAVDWREPWIMGLVAFNVVMLLLALLTRKRSGFQAGLFMLAMGIVYMGERLNKLGARHWRSFAGQNYFDPRGVFYSVMVSGPLMLAMFIVLINYLLACSAMLVEAKKKELRYKARQRAAAEKAAAAGGAAGGSGAGSGASAAERKKDK